MQDSSQDHLDNAEALTSADVQKRALSGTLLLAVKGVGLQVIGFATTILIAHFFTPAELGAVAFGITLTTLLVFVGGGQGLAGALIRRQDAGSKPTVSSNYSITRATKSFCLELDEFHLFVVNPPYAHRWKDCNTIFILKHANRCAREIAPI